MKAHLQMPRGVWPPGNACKPLMAVSEMNCHCPKGSRRSYKGPCGTGQRCSLFLRSTPQGGPPDSPSGTPRHQKGHQVAPGSLAPRLVQPSNDPGCHGNSWAGAEPIWIDLCGQLFPISKCDGSWPPPHGWVGMGTTRARSSPPRVPSVPQNSSPHVAGSVSENE